MSDRCAHTFYPRSIACKSTGAKLMQGPYSDKGDHWVERILSMWETCRLRDLPTFPILVEVVTCSFNGQHPDISWI
jgi:transposase